MDLIRQETGACILFVHHCGKDQAKGARGHSSLRAAVDTEIEVRASEDGDLKTATIVKQREMKKGDVFGFTLETVELGKNQYGEPVTTCVVKPDTEGKAQAQGQRLSDDQTAALKVLHDVMAQHGAAGHAGAPPDVPSVPEGWWRDRFYERCKIGASQDTKKRAFRRAVDGLQRAGKVAADAGRVWLP